MSFERKMRKHIDQVFEANVPNPFKKVEKHIEDPTYMPSKQKRSWFKVLKPIAITALCCGVAFVVVYPFGKMISSIFVGNEERTPTDNGAPAPNPYNSEPIDPVDHDNGNNSGANPENVPEGFTLDKNFKDKSSSVRAPKNNGMLNLNSEIISKSAYKTLQLTDSIFTTNSTSNVVLSPASYLLGAASIGAVSDDFNFEYFGLTNSDDAKALLENWNWYINYTNPDTNEEGVASSIDAAVLHQQVASKYAFDEGKRQELSKDYIATSYASPNTYLDQANRYFENVTGIDTDFSGKTLNSDGIITYSSIKMVDTCSEATTEKQLFRTKNNDSVFIDCEMLGTESKPVEVEYYENDNYIAFKRALNKSDMLIVMPKANDGLDRISISQVYSMFKANAISKNIYGFVPYFHLKASSINMTYSYTYGFNGSTVPYSKIVKDEVNLSFVNFAALQCCDFEYNNKGIAGKIDIKKEETNNSVSSDAIEVKVNRPFYAISLVEDFPMVVNKVCDPRKN